MYARICVRAKRIIHFKIFTVYKYENNQQDLLYRLIYYSKLALHVSGDVFAYHQEHLTVFTVSGAGHPSCCRLAAGSSLVEQYQILQIQSSASDNGRKHCLKPVEPNWNNKLIYTVNPIDYLHSCVTMHGFMNVKFRVYLLKVSMVLITVISEHHSSPGFNKIRSM
jgi:hypothetical protein